MNKISMTILLIVFISLNIFAQKERKSTLDDFSGTWILDEKKSFRDSEIKENFEDFTLVISNKEPELKILQSILFKGNPSEYTVTLWLDKRGEDNTYTTIRAFHDSGSTYSFYRLEDISLKTKSYFKDGKINREGSFKHDLDKYPFTFKETYSLSKDGKVLTISTVFTAITTEGSFDSELSRRLYNPSGSYKAIFHKK